MTANAALIRRAREAAKVPGLDQLSLIYAIVADEKTYKSRVFELVNLSDKLLDASKVLGTVEEIETIYSGIEEKKAAAALVAKEAEGALATAKSEAKALLAEAEVNISQSRARLAARESAFNTKAEVFNTTVTENNNRLLGQEKKLIAAQETLDNERASVTAREENVDEKERDVKRRLAIIDGAR